MHFHSSLPIKRLAAIITLLALSIPMQAAISVTNAGTLTDIGGNAASVDRTVNVSSTFSVIVVGVYMESEVSPLLNMTLNGATPDYQIEDVRGALAVFLNPSTGDQTLNIDPTAATHNGGGIGVWELSGVNLGASVISSTTDSITTTANDSFIVSWAYKNGGATLSPTLTSTIDTTLDIASYSPRSNAAAGGSTQAATIGTYDIGWNNDADGSPLAFAFQAATVPEPKIALLSIIGLLLLLRRRRTD